MKQIFLKYSNSEENFLKYLKVMVENELRSLKRDIPVSQITKLFGIGSELEELSRVLNEKELKVASIENKDLQKFCRKIAGFSNEEIIHRLNIPYDMSETFYAASVMFMKILDFFKCENVFVPRVTLRDGIIEDMIDKQNETQFYAKLEKQLKVNAINIGRYLNFDEKHSIKVLDFALKIFDATKNLHHLSGMEKCYLMVAAILHDVGNSVSIRSHHKHSLYVIMAQDFFYFNENEKKIIANIARYHRMSMPKVTHMEYMSLTHKDRMIVMKLSAILRIADSLDYSGLQIINDISLDIQKENIIITAKTNGGVFAEMYSFKFKRNLFEEFFGINVKLKTQREHINGK